MRPSFERFKASRQLKGTGLEPSIRSGPYMVEGGVHLDRGRAQHTARLQMRTEIIRRRAQAHVIGSLCKYGCGERTLSLRASKFCHPAILSENPHESTRNPSSER
jgi:hypothetical protein